jgi:hypothetical protein
MPSLWTCDLWVVRRQPGVLELTRSDQGCSNSAVPTDDERCWQLDSLAWARLERLDCQCWQLRSGVRSELPARPTDIGGFADLDPTSFLPCGSGLSDLKQGLLTSRGRVQVDQERSAKSPDRVDLEDGPRRGSASSPRPTSSRRRPGSVTTCSWWAGPRSSGSASTPSPWSGRSGTRRWSPSARWRGSRSSLEKRGGLSALG